MTATTTELSQTGPQLRLHNLLGIAPAHQDAELTR